MMSSQTAGVAALQLGRAAFHTTFLSVVHSVARPEAEELLPLKCGPRHCGQFATAVETSDSAPAKRAIAKMREFTAGTVQTRESPKATGIH